jgi:hypothetical protein
MTRLLRSLRVAASLPNPIRRGPVRYQPPLTLRLHKPAPALLFSSRPLSTAMAESTETLRVYNSLRPGAPVRLDPAEPGKVTWYACGPTVYDKSHLGHARNYVSTDIIRRILIHYFGLEVKFVMNITDIDDKVSLSFSALRPAILPSRQKL